MESPNTRPDLPGMAVMAGLVLSCLLSAGIPAADAAAQVPPPVQDEEEVLDEVIVEGTRLWELRAAIVKAEQRFYARYNELNKNDDFDVNCAVEAPLGTRLKKRVCRVAFYEEAQAEYAQALLQGVLVPDPEQVALQRREEYRKVALDLINSDRQLRRLVREREAAEEKYQQERRKHLKGRWVIF